MTTTINASTSAGLVQTADTSGALALQTAGTTAVTVTSAQLVGIGTTSPATTLDVFKTSGKTAIFGNATANNGNYITLAGNSTNKNWVLSTNMVVGAEFGISRTSANGGTDIGSTLDFMINSQGNASIGLSSVSGWTLGKGLEIGFAGGGLNATRQAEFNVNCNAYYDGTWRYGGTGKAAVIQFSDGTISTLTSTASGSAGGAISWTSGPYVANGGTSWTSSSDERLKNITGEIENALDKVGQLRAVKFTWKSDISNKAQIGLIAQDVQAVLPEVVNANAYVIGDETEYLGVNYDQVIPLLVASIKELKALNDTQAETINALTARIVALESK